MTLFILIVVLAVIVLAFSVTGLDYELKRIWRFQRRRAKNVAPANVAALLQQGTSKKHKVSLADVRDFVISLQLGTSMQATLTGSLAKAGEQFVNRGLFGERLRKHVEARLSISPDAVLEGLVEDFDCPQLAEVLERVRMASGGGISYNRVLAVSAAAIEEDIRRHIEQQIQKAPVRLTLPMVAGVFFPALVLGLIPLMFFAVAQMR